MKLENGFSIIELLVALAIASILITVGIPSFQKWLIQTRVEAQISEVNRLLLLTRNQAITTGEVWVLCPLDYQNKCSSNWNFPLVVFNDTNHNNRLDTASGEVIIKTKMPVPQGDKLLYGKGRKAIEYNATGRLNAWGNNGTFRYCPYNWPDLAKGVRVAVSGRTYITTDLDLDGKDEDRNRKELKCS